MLKQFKIKDLMINVIPEKWTVGGGGGGASLCSMDQASVDHTPITPHTPVILVARYTPRMNVLDSFADQIDNLEAEQLEHIALDMGRAAVAGKLMRGTALCTQEMATCANNERISPWASDGAFLDASDLADLKIQLRDAVMQIEKVEEAFEQRTREHARDLAPRLESALKDLKGQGMRDS